MGLLRQIQAESNTTMAMVLQLLGVVICTINKHFAILSLGNIEPQIYDIAKVIYVARQSDQAAEASWQDRMTFRREHYGQVIKRLQQEGLLNARWTVDEAADFVWALLSVHTYEYLVVERGWTVERLVTHLRTLIRHTIVKEPDAHT